MDDTIIELDSSAEIPVASQLSQTIRTGLPLESGLRALAQQTRSARTRAALYELCESLEGGTPLPQALLNSKTRLPRSMKALVDAGIESGRLDCLMQYSVEQTRNLVSLRQQIWLFLSYPMFLVWIATVICGATLYMIPTKLGAILDDFGTEVPGLTLSLIVLSNAMNSLGWVFWTLFALAFAIFLAALMSFGASGSGRRWSTSIPLIGRVFQYAALADLCRLLGLLAESNLPLPKALRFAGKASDDDWLARKCLIVAEDIESGTAPSTAVTLANLPSSLGVVFRNVGSKRIFVEAIRGLADIYSARCLNSTQLVGAIAAPLVITVVVGFIAIMMAAMFLPLIKLLNDLS